ncbi:hypothetical protein SLEP1_g32896 [Rubroshorea leprosula]|uniref:Zinc finger PHD-type domain-containing protein n=1 Tax=Rubroshorea leprosula TaxID=152421 RepID=A0AAV5KEW7_9ROSI|nr:hypothetical protein SLEP1_g32896 [Rubroshorea leprosula]
MSSSSSSMTKRKRGRSERVFKFKNFGENGYPAEMNRHGSFRQNVKVLLEYGNQEMNLCNGMLIWSFQLEVNRHPPLHVLLFVVEEPIESSLNLHCKHCQYVGWGHHMICNKKYHFMLPSKDTVAAFFNCDANCIDPNHPSKEKLSLVELQGHVMHGVFHCNGFGHLLCINGVETGSDLAGHQIMDFWDRLCTGLRARKVSLCDVSKKRGMELRLLHGLAYGKSWFGRWGYEFGRGCYGVTQPTSCRWSAKRVEAATQVIVEALEKVKFRWVSRQEVRDAARAYIGDTGLLDFVLKSLGNHMVGNYLVRRCLNPVTKVLEYCLEDVSDVYPNQDSITINKSKVVNSRYKITKAQLMKDIFYLYKHVLKEQKPTTLNTEIFSALPVAVRIILDTKFFVKEYGGDLSTKVDTASINGKLRLFCTVMLRNNEEIDCEEVKRILTPYECVTLKENATFDDLKLEVEKEFREVYWKLENFVVESIVNVNVKGTDMVSRKIEMGQKIICLGSKKERGILTEGGEGNQMVDCPCGAKDDDGERLVLCDVCEVWQHSRCVGIPNNKEIPPIFLCKRCDQNIMLLPSLP